MAAAVDPLLARIAELAPEEAPKRSAEAEFRCREAAARPARQRQRAVPAAAPRPAAAQALPQAKSVRISLERLDRMMNAVGELVINRTRMLGRLAELSKLVEVLQFSKARLAGKVSDFQEKHEFSRIVRHARSRQPATADGYVPRARHRARARSRPTTCSSSANSKWIATTISISCRAR